MKELSESDKQLIELNERRYKRARKEVRDGVADLINPLLNLLEFGPSEESKLTKEQLKDRLTRLLDEYFTLMHECFGHEDPLESREEDAESE